MRFRFVKPRYSVPSVALMVVVGVVIAGSFGAFASANSAPSLAAPKAKASLPPTPVLSTASDAIGLLTAHQGSLARIAPGIDTVAIRNTRLLHVVTPGPGGAPQGVFQTSFGDGGVCVTFAAAIACSSEPLSDSHPVVAVTLDPDSPQAGEPFRLAGITAPNVTDVSYVCDGTTYSATLKNHVTSFTSPSSTITPPQCTQQVTLSSGRVVNLNTK